MKAEKLIDVCISSANCQVVIELGNGHRLSTSDYYYSTNKKGEQIILIKTGREMK